MVMIMMKAVVALMRVDRQHQLLFTEKRRHRNKLVLNYYQNINQ